MYGKWTKQLCGTKSPSQIGEKAELPGERVLVNQLYLTVTVLIAELKVS
jgi:hypothetical protein